MKNYLFLICLLTITISSFGQDNKKKTIRDRADFSTSDRQKIAESKKNIALLQEQLKTQKNAIEAARKSYSILTDPDNARLKATDAVAWIQAYADAPENTGEPFSFVMNAASLRSYLNGNMSAIYLHIYLGYKNRAAEQDFLAIGINTSGAHIWETNPAVYGDFKDAAEEGVAFDNLDDMPTANPNQFTAFADNSLVKRALGQKYITRYQLGTLNDNDVLTYSFLVGANELRKFLNDKNFAYSPGGTAIPVPYLQLYFAYKDADYTKKEVVILLVGVSATGEHVYYRYSDGVDYVFDQCAPCPECGIDRDPQICGPID